MKISHRLTWGYGLLVLMSGVFGLLAWQRATELRVDVEHLHLTGVNDAANVRMLAAVDKLDHALDALLESARHGQPSPGHWPQFEAALATLRETSAKASGLSLPPANATAGFPPSREEKLQLTQITRSVQELTATERRLQAPDLSPEARLALLRHLAALTRQQLAPAVSSYQELVHERVFLEIARTKRSTNGLFALLLTAGLLSLACCAYFALAIHRHVVAPLLRFETLARAITQGDHQIRLSPHHGNHRDELGTLATTFDAMLDHLDATSVSRRELETLVRQRNEQLHESEERLRDIFDNTTDLIQSIDPEGRFLYVNRAWRDALGYAEAELPGLRILDIIAPEFHDHCGTLMQRLLAGETVGAIELTFVTKSGRRLPVEGHVNARIETGRPVITRGIFRDISVRQQSQEIARQQLVFLESLNQTALDLLRQPQLSVLLPAVAERAARLLDSPYAEIALIEGDELVVRSVHGPAVSTVGERANRQQAVFSWRAIDRRDAVLIEDFSLQPEGRDLYRRWGFHAVALFPILRGAECLGVIALLRLRPGHVFSSEDVEKGRLLARLTALILHNTAIYEEALRAAETKTTALLESEKVYRHLVENINQGFYTADYYGKFLYYNPAICIVSGRTAEELDGTNSFRLVAPEDRLRVIRRYRDWAHGTETDVRIEFRITTKTPGRPIWMEQVSHIVRDATGQAVEFRNSLHDITERKAAEKALQESEERFHLLFDSTPLPTVLSTLPDGVIVDVNQAALDHFNYTREQSIGRKVMELSQWLRPDDRENFIHQLQTVGCVSDFEAPRRLPDGRIVHLLHNSRIVTLNGRPHALSTTRDITERKAADQALRESEERFRMLFDSSPIPVVLSSVPEGVIVDVNQAALTHFNYTREQAVGRTALDLALWVNPADREHFIHQLQTTGLVQDFEAVMQVRDGRTLNILHHSRIVTLNGRPHAINTIRDITAQRQAETEINRLALLAQETDHAVVLTNIHGHIVWANEGFTRLNGYTLEEVKGRKPGEFLRGPKSDPATRLLIRERLARHEKFSIDVRNYHKDGHSYWARLSIQPWRDNLGRLQGYFAMSTDITDRVLEGESMRLLALGRTAPEGVDVLHYMAQQLPDLLEVDACLIGLPDHTVRGHFRTHGFSLGDRLQADFVAPLDGNIAGFLLGNISVTDPLPVPPVPLPQMPDLVDFVGAPLPGPDHAPLGFIAVLSRRPIGHRSRVEPVLQRLARKLSAELARSRAERMFHDLFAFAPDAILIANIDGRITDVNQRTLTLFGFSREDLIGHNAAVLIPPDHQAALQQRLDAYLANPVPHAMGESAPGLVARDKSGREFPIDISLSPLNNGHGSFVVVAIRDITREAAAEQHRLKAEAQLRQSQKIESLGTLAGGIAHDFNNILTGMLGAAEIARLELPATHPAAAWIDHIVSGGSRAKHLVQQILTFSRKNEGQLTPQLLQPVITEALGLLRSTIPSMIRIETRIDPACPPVLADGTQIHQVIMNLCTNAWHAVSETDGLIVISLAPVHLARGSARARAGLSPGTYVQLTIRDNGCGMTPAEQEHLFEPFYTTKPKGRGTGLGLAVVHGIIEGHHGVISIHSIPGLGTRFEILLPAMVVPASTASITTAADIVHAGCHNRILLVDDDAISLTALQGQLEHVGYLVTTESDPKAALQRFTGNPDGFDLVLSDFAMAGMTGLQLAAKILAVRPQIPLILISGYVEPKQADEIRATGVREFLRKPVSFAELSKAVARHLGPPPAIRV